MAKFQIQLAGAWKDYTDTEDQILKRAYMAGFPNCRFTLRGASYEYSFDRMVQKNLTTGKERKIRAPHLWEQPAQPIVPKGPTLYMKVPAGSPGKTIEIDHPKGKGVKMQVAVPQHAKVGQDMLVPIQDVAVATNVSVVTAGVVAVPSGSSKEVEGNDIVQPRGTPKAAVLLSKAKSLMSSKSNRPAAVPSGNDTNAKNGWSTRAKLAAGGAAAAALGGGAFLTAYAATEARDGSGGGAPPTDDCITWYPEASDAYYDCPLPIGSDGAAPEADGWCPDGGEDAGDVTDVPSWCPDGGEDAGEPDEILCAEDDAEWLADMCGVQEEFSGCGEDAVADLVVDLF